LATTVPLPDRTAPALIVVPPNNYGRVDGLLVIGAKALIQGDGQSPGNLVNNIVTDSTGGTASETLAAITAGSGYSQADMQAVQNALASLAANQNAIISVLRNAGLSL
jgi:hypothetical protein